MTHLVRRQKTTMQDGQLVHLLPSQTLPTPISGMNRQRHHGLLSPAMQRFWIDGKQFATLHQRKQGHENGSFRVTQQTQGRFPGIFPQEFPRRSQGFFPRSRDVTTQGEPDLQEQRRDPLSLDDVCYDNSWQGSGGSVATRTRSTEG